MTETINTAGDIIWEDCYLVNFKGERIHILALVPEINLYEDIYSNGIHGQVTVVDTKNLLSLVPIIGQEFLILKFHTPKATPAIFRTFRIVKVEEKVMTGGKQVYKLFFTSVDSWLDLTYTENKVLAGTADTIIRDTITRMRDWANREYQTTPSIGVFDHMSVPVNRLKIISPNWSPLECAAYAVRNSVGSDGVADFLFYDTLSGYRLVRLTELMKQAVSETLVYDHSDSKGVPELQYRKINDMQFINVVDNVNATLNKYYGHTMIDHNLLTKKVTIKKVVPSDQNKATLNGKPMFVENTNFKFAGDHVVTISHSYPKKHNDVPVDRTADVMATRSCYLNKLEMTKANIEIWGRTWLQVGHLIEIKLGTFSQGKQTGDDQYTSGKYLITAIQHILSPAQHKMVCQVVTESNLIEYK